MKELKLRPYQQEPAKFALEENMAVLALAPNGGKTEIAIYVAEQYLKNNPKHRILILPHSTNVLMDNFVQRLEKYKDVLSFKFSDEFDKDAQVHIALPQSKKRIYGKYDFVIVDEAHENYLAGRVQGIIKRVKPKKQLLLTGTPSKFIYKNMLSKSKGEEEKYKIHILALMDIPKEFYARLTVELISSSYNWQEKDYTNSLSIKEDYKYNKKDTEKSLEKVLSQLIKRLQTKVDANSFNSSNFVPNIKKYFMAVVNSLGKTIIYASNVQHANQIYEVLKNNDLNVTVSHSKETNGLETDIDSSRVNDFQNGLYDILIVVDRAKLGYSDSDVRNIIDMSGTMNPDLIYQMLCRAVRGDQSNRNFYLKVTPRGKARKDLTDCYTNMALQLMDKETISKFNGKNINEQLIVIERSDTEKSEKGGTKKRQKTNRETKVILPQYINDIHSFFTDINTNESSVVTIYKKTTLGEVRTRLGDLKTNFNGYWTYQRCKEAASKFESAGEFKEKEGSSHSASLKNNWLYDFFPDSKSHYKKTDKEIIEEISVFKSRNELRKEKNGLYDHIFKKRKYILDKVFGKSFLNITHKDYLKSVPKNIEVLEEYLGCKTKIKHRCKKCNHIWKVTPSKIKQGKGCPKCGRERMKKAIMKPVIHLKTNKVYESLADACRKLELNYNTEANRINKNLKTKQFKYITEQEYNKLKDK